MYLSTAPPLPADYADAAPILIPGKRRLAWGISDIAPLIATVLNVHEAVKDAVRIRYVIDDELSGHSGFGTSRPS